LKHHRDLDWPSIGPVPLYSLENSELKLSARGGCNLMGKFRCTRSKTAN